MKNSILAVLCIALISSVAQAASINWSISGSTTSVLYAPNNDGTVSTTPLGGATLYLILATEENLASLETYAGKKDKKGFDDALKDMTLNSTYSTTETGTRPTVADVVVSSPSLSSGTSTPFALLVMAPSADGSVFYKQITATGIPYADGSTPDAQTTLTTQWGKMTSATASTWKTVPEPSVALMGLLGLGMLLKRRRA